MKPRARIVATTLVGVDPVTMLKGPIPASRKVLAQTGLTVEQIDTFEVNEAFASVVLAWEKELRPNPERVNPNGGAIALGHPTGCDRRAAHHDGAARARAHRRPLRSDRDVLRRRARDGDDHRAALTADPALTRAVHSAALRPHTQIRKTELVSQESKPSTPHDGKDARLRSTSRAVLVEKPGCQACSGGGA